MAKIGSCCGLYRSSCSLVSNDIKLLTPVFIPRPCCQIVNTYIDSYGFAVSRNWSLDGPSFQEGHRCLNLTLKDIKFPFRAKKILWAPHLGKILGRTARCQGFVPIAIFVGEDIWSNYNNLPTWIQAILEIVHRNPNHHSSDVAVRSIFWIDSMIQWT